MNDWHTIWFTKAQALVAVLWVVYAAALFKLIMMDSWATIAAGIGDLDLPGFKVGAMALLPFVGMTALVWNWNQLTPRRFVVLALLMAAMPVVGVAAYCYLWHLHANKDIVHPNETAMVFTVLSLLYMGLVALIYFVERELRLRRHREAGVA